MAARCPNCDSKIASWKKKYTAFPCPKCTSQIKIVDGVESSFRKIFWILPPFIDLLFILICDLFSSGNVEAVYATPGEILRSDAIVPEPTKEVLELKDFANLGDPASQYKIGKAYLEGSGVQQNDRDALNWFLKAAEQGHVDAQSQAGRMSFMGEGTSRNNEEAYFWYSLAAKGGNSQKWADSVARYLKPDQISTVEKRVAEWTPKKN
jgi:TPR repeat protein